MDIQFELKDGLFNQRAAGMIFNEDGDVLVQRKCGEGDNQWALPGGKLKFGEHSAAALTRELNEEFGFLVSEIRINSVCEHIISLNGTRIQQTVFLYDVVDIMPKITVLDKSIEAKWLHVEQIKLVKPSWVAKVIASKQVHFTFGFEGG